MTTRKIKFLKEQISITKVSLKKSKFPPYRREFKKSLKFWQEELKKQDFS